MARALFLRAEMLSIARRVLNRAGIPCHPRNTPGESKHRGLSPQSILSQLAGVESLDIRLRRRFQGARWGVVSLLLLVCGCDGSASKEAASDAIATTLAAAKPVACGSLADAIQLRVPRPDGLMPERLAMLLAAETPVIPQLSWGFRTIEGRPSWQWTIGNSSGLRGNSDEILLRVSVPRTAGIWRTIGIKARSPTALNRSVIISPSMERGDLQPNILVMPWTSFRRTGSLVRRSF